MLPACADLECLTVSLELSFLVLFLLPLVVLWPAVGVKTAPLAYFPQPAAVIPCFSRPEFDPLPALAGEVDLSDSLTDQRQEYLRLLCLHFQPESYCLHLLNQIQLRICILGLEISVLCLPKLLQSSSTYLEDVTEVHSKNCQVIVLTPEGLPNSITRANLKPAKRKHKIIPLLSFGGSVDGSFFLSVNWCLKRKSYLDCTKLLLGDPVFIEEELHSL